MTTTRKPRRKPCPLCGSRDTARVIWGLYVGNLLDLPDHVVLGGCCVLPEMPTRYCHTCGRYDDGTRPPASVFDDADPT
jgi:hypothetical protein